MVSKHKFFAFGFGSILTMFPRLPDELRTMEPDEQLRTSWYSIQPLSEQHTRSEKMTLQYNVVIDKYGKSRFTTKGTR